MPYDDLSSVKFSGLDKVLARIDEYGAEGVEAARRGVEQFGQHVLTESQKRVPYEFGDLQKAIIDEPISGGTKVIGYDTPYATAQHENRDFMHPGDHSESPNMARAAQGQAKYLENPLKENAHLMKEFVENQLDKLS